MKSSKMVNTVISRLQICGAALETMEYKVKSNPAISEFFHDVHLVYSLS